jgi:Fur family transcriptional regulator, ferric uptake regulator
LACGAAVKERPLQPFSMAGPIFNAMRSVIPATTCPLSSGEVLETARSQVNALGLATVYRKTRLLVAEGAVQVITLPTECSRYEMAESAHHHHFQCNTCGRAYDVAGCPGDLRRLAPRGFTVEHHDVALHGGCRDCARREMRASR